MSGGTADSPAGGALTRLLCLITRVVARRPRATLWLVALSVAACAGIAALGLRFKTSRSDLIDPQASFQQRWLEFTDKFGDQSDIVVVVEAEDPAHVRVALDALGNQLLREPELFAKVNWKFDPAPLLKKGLQYLSPTQLEQGLARLESYTPILQGHWNRAGLESYSRRLAVHARSSHEQQRTREHARAVEQATLLCDSLTAFSASVLGTDTSPVATASADSSIASTRPTANFASPWPLIFADADSSLSALSEVRYQVTGDGRMGFLTAVATAGEQDFSGTSPTLARLRTLLELAQRQFPEVTLGLTGIPVLESDEMQRSQTDMAQASMISFAGVAIILLIGFRGLKHPLLGLLMLLVGLAWTIGYTTLVIGHLNILSISFAAILIGMGIDFAIHYLARYLELRHAGLELDQALEQTSASVGTGLTTAAVTTSLAFLCAAFTRFLGVAELGIIAGGGILLCGAATFVVLAPLIRAADQRVEPRKLPAPFQAAGLRWMTQRFPRAMAVLSGVCIVVVALQSVELRDGKVGFKVEYDSNLLNLQAEDVESVAVQHKVFKSTNGSLLYAVSLADGPEQARRLAERFAALDSVAHVEHLAGAVPEYSAAETALLVQAIHAQLAQLAPFPREFPAIDPLAVGQALEELHTVLQTADTPAGLAAASRLDAFLDRLELVPVEQQVQLLNGYQSAMLTALRVQFERIAEVSDPLRVSVDDLPAGLRERFVSPHGDWMLRIFPREQVWDEAPLEAFVADVRTVDSEATGTPLQNYEAARQIRQSYLNAALYAFLAVCLVLLIDALASGPLCVALLTPLIVVAFGVVTLVGPNQTIDYRWMLCLYVGMVVVVGAIFDFANVRNMLLSMTPSVVGLAMMFGVLGYLGMHLNPANIIVLPLLLGIGVDDGVHVLHDFRNQSHGYKTSASTINAVVLTSLTSMVGFGSLMVASHRGLQSLGLVLVVGVGTCLFVSLVALPAVLTMIAGRAWQPSAATDSSDSPVLLSLPPRTADSELVGRTLRAAS